MKLPIIFIIVTILYYITGMVIGANFHPFLWNEDVRTGIGISWIGTLFIISVVKYMDSIDRRPK